MRVVVTGGAGFIGSNLSKELSQRGHDVIVVDNLSGGFIEDVPKTATFVNADVASEESLPKADLYYHLAASFANWKSVESPLNDARDNVLGTVNVASFCAKNGIRLIYTGSSSSYGYKDGNALTEYGSTNPSTPYALSKLVGEQYVKLFSDNYLNVRLFNVFGPGDRPGEYRNAIPNMVVSGIVTGTVPVYGQGCGRDFSYIDDIVFLLSELATKDVGYIRTLNLASGRMTLMESVAKEVVSELGLLGHSCQINMLERRPWDKVVTRIAGVGLQGNLFGGYANKMADNFSENLRKTVRWVVNKHESV